MNANIPDIYKLLQEIAWCFGDHGFDGNCCEDMSLVEFMALKKTYENHNSSVQEIGSALNFTKSGATRIIDRLENKGYVTRERSSIDGRVCCVPVTDKGSEVITKVMEKNTRDLDEMLKDLEPAVVEHIKDILEILLKAVRRQELI